MKYLKLLFFVFMLSLSFGCSSSDDDINIKNSNQTCKISKIFFSVYNGIDTFDVSYSNGNITQLLSSKRKVIFTYSSNQLTTEEIINLSNNQTEYKIEFITTNGKITEERTYKQTRGALEYTGKNIYGYSGNNLTLIQHYESDNTFSHKLEINWANNNPASVSYYDETNVLDCTFTLKHDNTQVNKFNAEFPMFLFQHFSRDDLLKCLFLGNNNLTSMTGTCSSHAIKFAITYNSNGYISDIKQNTTALYKFEYTCP